MAMTDKEKAATYVGWIPERPCQHRERYDGSLWGNGVLQCSVCYCRIGLDRCEHVDRAPDMGRPENYIRALEHLHARGSGYLQWGNGCFMATNLEDGKDVYGPNKPTIAEAVVGFLAVLYDAEHKEDQVSKYGGSA